MTTTRMNMALYNLIRRTSNVTDAEAQEAATLDDAILNKIDFLDTRFNLVYKELHGLKIMITINTTISVGILLKLLFG